MPYKFNQSRRHKIPKGQFFGSRSGRNTTRALVKRGTLTVWMTEEAIAACATGKRGGQPIYSAIAILLVRVPALPGW
jgi:hypothetical protein